MNLNELYAKRASAWEAAKNFLDTHRMENGTLSAEDSATYDRMEADIENLTKEIERLTKLNEMENALRQPTSNPLTNRPGDGTPSNDGKGRASKQYVADMLTGMRTEFKRVSDVLEEGTDANGGYLVPEEWDNRLIDKLNEENVMRKLGTKITTSGEHKINMAATKPAASWIAVTRPSISALLTLISSMWLSRLPRSCCMIMRSTWSATFSISSLWRWPMRKRMLS